MRIPPPAGAGCGRLESRPTGSLAGLRRGLELERWPDWRASGTPLKSPCDGACPFTTLDPDGRSGNGSRVTKETATFSGADGL